MGRLYATAKLAIGPDTPRVYRSCHSTPAGAGLVGQGRAASSHPARYLSST